MRVHQLVPMLVVVVLAGTGTGLVGQTPAPSATSVTYPGGKGPGQGRHVVWLTGDEEYRSEEALPMLAKIASQRHGFRSTVLFSVDADGTINPKNTRSLSEPITTAPTSGCSKRRRCTASANSMSTPRSYEFSFSSYPSWSPPSGSTSMSR